MSETPSTRPRRRSTLAAALLATLALVALAAPAESQAKKHKVKVMTRNLDLGADLGPGLRATNLNQLLDGVGQILNQVDQNNFPVRARGLASEILKSKPDLVGLQEASLWRTAPCHLIVPPNPPTATHVRYDYLRLLLRRLNRGKRRYKVLVPAREFDFETEANTNGSPDHSCDTNARLTMRDAILVRVRAGIKARHVEKNHFTTLLAPKLVGLITVPVIRGWTRTDVKVRGSRWFRFVNTHLEAFDNQASNPTNRGTSVGNGQLRKAQAKELVKKGGAATGKRPVILLGDLNSDRRTEVKPGDALAYKALVGAGFRERSTSHPLGCCLQGALLTVPGGGGKVSDFDHKVDHVMTDAPRRVKLLKSWVTGRHPVNGFWDADHAGLVSKLRIP